MDIAHVLRDILIVLVAAKLAAEFAERIGIPAVVGEIVAGVLIGPSLLGVVGNADEVLRTLGEIGVILLLLDVGLEMDLGELTKVGRASMLVATVGVVSPMVLGFAAMRLFVTDDLNTSLFVAAALTATSVGITARVFGDLRALATTEARIVLGAAVADDVMGLVVLTVVVRLVTEGSVSLGSVVAIVAIAVGFLLVGGLVGLRVAPPLFGLVERVSRSTGTLVALALAFALAFAQLADAASLAPIVGAFLAGLALNRAEQAPRIRRELAPVGHLFIPVFFLQIGIDADIGAFASPTVLRDAAILLVVAVVGKLVSPIGAAGTPGDRWLIGLGMLPRGEVGLIFATIGLQNGVLGDDLYAALLVVVLVTTLATPQLLKLRYNRIRGGSGARAVAVVDAEPAGGWLVTNASSVELAANPPTDTGLTVALQAATAVAYGRPSAGLLDWLSSVEFRNLKLDGEVTAALFEVLRQGNARSWRFLETIGALDRVLPEVAQTLRERQADPFRVDPMSTHRWSAIERLRTLDEFDPLQEEYARLAHPEWLLLGALLVEGLEGRRNQASLAEVIGGRLGLDTGAVKEIAALVEDRDLLWGASHRLDGMTEEAVLQLASHLDTPEQARALYLLSAVRGDDRERWEFEQLLELHNLVQKALANPALTGVEARNLVGNRRAEAAALVGGEPHLVDRIQRAPRAYVLHQDSAGIARQVRLLDPMPSRSARVLVTPLATGGYFVDVAAKDQPRLLACVTGALADAGLDVSAALIATWPDGTALESFLVRAEEPPDPGALRLSIQGRFEVPLSSPALAEAQVTFDDDASPWHSVIEVRSPDKPGLLHALATSFAAAGVEVQSARIDSDDGLAVDRFEVTDAEGAKLDEGDREAVRRYVLRGATARRRRFRRTFSFSLNAVV